MRNFRGHDQPTSKKRSVVLRKSEDNFTFKMSSCHS